MTREFHACLLIIYSSLFSNSKKRTRSASTASDHQSGTAPLVDQTPTEKPAPPVSKPSAGRNKRAGRKVTTVETVELEEGSFLYKFELNAQLRAHFSCM